MYIHAYSILIRHSEILRFRSSKVASGTKTFLEIGPIGNLCFKGASISRMLGSTPNPAVICVPCLKLFWLEKKLWHLHLVSLGLYKECASKADEYSEPSEALMRAIGTAKPLTWQHKDWQKRSCANLLKWNFHDGHIHFKDGHLKLLREIRHSLFMCNIAAQSTKP